MRKEIKKFHMSHVIKKKARQYDYDKIKFLIYVFNPLILNIRPLKTKFSHMLSHILLNMKTLTCSKSGSFIGHII